MTAASRPRRSATSGPNWRQIVAQYQNPDIRHSVGQILTSIVPYFALLTLMYFSLSVSYWLTLLLAIPAAGFMMRIFIIFHDCGHGSFFKNRKANDIVDRLSEISFNASLITELRFIAERNPLIDSGDLSKDKFSKTHLHMIHGDQALGAMPASSKLVADREFLLQLRDMGREAASEWLEDHGEKIGNRSSFNYRRMVNQLTQESEETPEPSELLKKD